MEDTTTAIAAALGQVGPRLKQLRARRGEGAQARARTVGKKASAE